MAAQKTRTVVKIKKGQRVILPADAQIVSITEVDGASAESLCDLPAPTPLVNYTFFFDRRAEGQDADDDHTLRIQRFVLGDNEVTWNGVYFQQDTNLCQASFVGPIKDTPGVAALYACCDCGAGSGCNNYLTMSIPSSLPPPYFTMFAKDDSSDPWIFRLDPLDFDNPLQVSNRPECTTRV